MDKTVKFFTAFIVILCTAVFLTGCTSNSGAANATANSTTTISTQSTTIAAAGAIYTAGDIVKSPSGSAGTGWLVLDYDTATDTYSRALIYQNPDGTWGYRADTNTENSARSVMEKVYTVRVTHVSVSTVPVKTATAAPTSTLAMTSTVTTSATTVTTTTPTGKPQFISMVPDSAAAGSQVSITDLTGSNFRSGTTVMLAHTGSSNITATNVQAVSSSHMTCTFTVPSNATTGSWDIVITNPDGQSVTNSNFFAIRAATNVSAAQTTSPTGTVVITRIEPTTVVMGGYGWNGPLTIYTTTNIQIGATAKLVNSGGQEILGTSGAISDTLTSIPVRFNIPGTSRGQWNVVLTNPDGTNGILVNGLTVY